MQDVGIVVPVFGRFDMLRDCLEVLPRGVPVYVVDDCTPDPKERKEIKEFVLGKGFRYFTNGTNSGFPATVNKGIAKSTEPLVLILNSDVVLQPNAFEVMVSEFKDNEVGVVAPMLLFPENCENGPMGKVQHVGLVFDVMGRPRHLFLGWDPGNPKVFKRRDTLQAVTGACMMTRRSILKQTGGFAVVYGRGTYEDVEFCVLAKTLGFKVVCNPEAIGLHAVAQSAKILGGYPLRENHLKFVSRVGNVIRNDDYMFL